MKENVWNILVSFDDNRQKSYNWYNANSNCYFWSRVITIEGEETIRDSYYAFSS